MKKSLLALAVLGAFAGVASAQSSVTLFGTVDLSAKYVKNDGFNRRVSLDKDGLNSSQLGFRGTEDLGGGLKAGFLLLGATSADTGNAGGGGKFFNRSSYLRLWGNFGEVRLGRDYTPTFWNQTIFDAFGTVGLGSSLNVQQLTDPAAGIPGIPGNPTGNGTFVRADNSIGYFLPSGIGGVYGQFMAAASEGATGNPGRYLGGRIGFAAGPFDIAGAYSQQRIDTIGSAPNRKTYNIGGSYDLGVVKLMSYYDRDSLSYGGFDRKEDRFSFSGVVPLGQGEIHAGYDRSKLKNSIAPATSNTISQFKVGYVYNLSKRTAVYSNYSRLSNGGNNVTGSTNTVAGGTSQTASPTPGGKSNGVEFGLRHFF